MLFILHYNIDVHFVVDNILRLKMVVLTMLLFKTIDNFVVEVIVVTICFAWLWTTINLVCIVIGVLSYTITINIVEFNFGVLAIVAILVTKHIVSHSFTNFWFCCFENVNENMVENILENNYFTEQLGGSVSPAIIINAATVIDAITNLQLN